MTLETIAERYTASALKSRDVMQAHEALATKVLSAYNLYYAFRAQVGEKLAMEYLSDAFAAADEMERSALSVQNARSEIIDTVTDCLIDASAVIGIESSGSRMDVAERLAHDLGDLDAFRAHRLDGVKSRFVDLLKDGVGFRASERDRLLNRVVASWCKAQSLKLRDTSAAVGEWIESLQIDDTPSLGLHP